MVTLVSAGTSRSTTDRAASFWKRASDWKLTDWPGRATTSATTSCVQPFPLRNMRVPTSGWGGTVLVGTGMAGGGAGEPTQPTVTRTTANPAIPWSLVEDLRDIHVPLGPRESIVGDAGERTSANHPFLALSVRPLQRVEGGLGDQWCRLTASQSNRSIT